MNRFVATLLGGAAGYALGAFVTDPVFGPVPPPKALPGAPPGSLGWSCGRGFGDNRPCEPGLVCQADLLSGKCVSTDEIRNRSLAHAAFIMTGLAAGYMWSKPAE